MDNEQVKAQLAEAKALIQQKRYADARKVLKRINDPTARQWEAKLDSIAPAPPVASSPVINYAIFTLVGAVIGLLIGFVVGNSIGSRSAQVSIAVLPTLDQSSTPDTAATDRAANSEAATRIVATETAIVLTETACDPQGWWNTVDEPVARFLDTAKTASSTARMALSTVILEMRQAFRDFDNADHPDCMDEVYFMVRSGMTSATEGFENFMAQNEIISSVQLNLATQYFYNAYVALLKDGAVGTSDMFNTAVFVWGGDEPTDPKATEMYLTRLAPLPFEITLTADAASSAKLDQLYSTATAAYHATAQASNP